MAHEAIEFVSLRKTKSNTKPKPAGDTKWTLGILLSRRRKDRWESRLTFEFPSSTDGHHIRGF